MAARQPMISARTRWTFTALRQRGPGGEGKAVLVSIGAEWCGWCCAFDARMKSAKRRYDRVKKEKRGDISQGAPVLARFTAENFVAVHIEDDFAPGAEDVVAAAGAEA